MQWGTLVKTEEVTTFNVLWLVFNQTLVYICHQFPIWKILTSLWDWEIQILYGHKKKWSTRGNLYFFNEVVTFGQKAGQCLSLTNSTVKKPTTYYSKIGMALFQVCLFPLQMLSLEEAFRGSANLHNWPWLLGWRRNMFLAPQVSTNPILASQVLTNPSLESRLQNLHWCNITCCIFRPSFGCCARQRLVDIVIFSVFAAKNQKKNKKFAANLQQISA